MHDLVFQNLLAGLLIGIHLGQCHIDRADKKGLSNKVIIIAAAVIIALLAAVVVLLLTRPAPTDIGDEGVPERPGAAGWPGPAWPGRTGPGCCS